MKKINLKLREGDTKEIQCTIPPEFIGGEVTLLILLTEDTGILKTTPATELVSITLDESDTVTRLGRYDYEIRVKKDDAALVLVQGKITVEDSHIVRADITPSPPVAIIAGGGGGGTPGKSAYQIALDNGFVGTTQEWLDSLVGPPGAGGRTDFDELIYKMIAPDGNNLGPNGEMALNGSTYNISDFPEIDTAKAMLIARGLITDNGDGTITTVVIEPTVGWRKLYEHTSGARLDRITNDWGTGHYRAHMYFQAGSPDYMSYDLFVADTGVTTYSATYGAGGNYTAFQHRNGEFQGIQVGSYQASFKALYKQAQVGYAYLRAQSS